jgi:hypothetical protein
VGNGGASLVRIPGLGPVLQPPERTGQSHPDGTSAYTGVNPIADPYGTVATPSYSSSQCDQGQLNGNNGYKLSGNGNGNTSATLPPNNFSGSVYVFCNGIDLTSANVSLTLRSGFTYVINKGSLAVGGNAQLTVNGATIFLTNSTGGVEGVVLPSMRVNLPDDR